LCGVDSEVHSPLVQGGDLSGRDNQAPDTVLTTIHVGAVLGLRGDDD
jgi:hypothetical protein